ncbi:hypothetical protein PPL_04058 [Heterostelium album PN500]|uniref:Uncharacterized protein n=1 Tax=Heterostelium pallidum (strain ATCC 26659 / Pp 5 / PN500) TaxID=670386 RepID=D3B5X0_HETP5|nr:hypothetical protein PPL_04058 [Heterostelium album PN500]EFA83268.1 hypothetical protein PPL_04058 [Heterostelium album PN500]|eukprot:XP_020435385.1 hypothetical protein PPL_04058 [Heterostelium album PN500]
MDMESFQAKCITLLYNLRFFFRCMYLYSISCDYHALISICFVYYQINSTFSSFKYSCNCIPAYIWLDSFKKEKEKQTNIYSYF